jgi:hypothetical protein
MNNPKEPLCNAVDGSEKANEQYFAMLGRSLFNYIEQHKDELPSMSVEDAKHRGVCKLNDYCWKQEVGVKTCAWVRHIDGKLYTLTPK